MVRNVGLCMGVALASAAGLMACSSPDSLGSSSDELVDTAGGARQIPEVTVEALLTRAGFAPAVVPKMVCVAYYGSGLNDLAVRRRSNGTFDIGLFLINTVHVKNTPTCPLKPEDLYDANANAKCAHAVYAMSGLRAFPAYADHKAECDAWRVHR